jgi:excisionase family DNA binding protein
MERMTYTVREAAKVLGIGRLTAYNGVKSGAIPALRIGRRLVVPKAAIEKLLAEAGKAEAA